MRNQQNCNTRGSKEVTAFKITRKVTIGLTSIHHTGWNKLL